MIPRPPAAANDRSAGHLVIPSSTRIGRHIAPMAALVAAPDRKSRHKTDSDDNRTGQPPGILPRILRIYQINALPGPMCHDSAGEHEQRDCQHHCGIDGTKGATDNKLYVRLN